MISERAASELLSDLVNQGFVSQTERDHALRTRDLVATIGGVERDRTLALLHELPDGSPDLMRSLDEETAACLRAMTDSMPDLLRHSDAEIEDRALRLANAAIPTTVVWLCDLIDTFETDLVRIECEASIKEALATRSRMATQMTEICARHPRFTSLVARARAAVMHFSIKAAAGLVTPQSKTASGPIGTA